MRVLKGRLHELYDILNRGGVWTTIELCKEIGFSTDFYRRETLRSLINNLRKKFRDSSIEYDNPWMFNNGDAFEELQLVGTTAEGYTLERNSVGRAFECRMRANQATNIMLNGAPVFADFKKLAPKAFFNMSIEIKPKLLKLNHLVK